MRVMQHAGKLFRAVVGITDFEGRRRRCNLPPPGAQKEIYKKFFLAAGSSLGARRASGTKARLYQGKPGHHCGLHGAGDRIP